MRNVPIKDSLSENDQALFLPMITLKEMKPLDIFNQISAPKMNIKPFDIPNNIELRPIKNGANPPAPEKPIQQQAKPIPPQVFSNLNARAKEDILLKELIEKNISHLRQKAAPQKPARPAMQPSPLTASIKSPPEKLAAGQKIIIQALAKISPLLSDTSIQTVECPGPGKPILVYKSGLIQTTNLILTSEEINRIMQEISEKTRIPLISGIFKAAWESYIVTAVMSEFVGTRFILQKKKPEIRPGQNPSNSNAPSLPNLPPSPFQLQKFSAR